MWKYGNKDYMKSRMRENRTYGSVRGNETNLSLGNIRKKERWGRVVYSTDAKNEKNWGNRTLL